MAELKQCEVYLLRYVPDAVKDEFVNLGVVLLETGEGDGLFTDVRFTRDWRRVRCLDPEADVELLESFEEEIRRMLQSRAAEVINYRGPMSRREWLLRLLEDGLSNTLQITPAKAVLTESPQKELGELAQMYLESARHGGRAASDLCRHAGGVRGRRRLGAGAPGYCVGELWEQGRSAKDRFWIQAEWRDQDVPGGFVGDGCGRGEGARVQLSRVAGGIAAGGECGQ
jgi:hypothetical protein